MRRQPGAGKEGRAGARARARVGGRGGGGPRLGRSESERARVSNVPRLELRMGADKIRDARICEIHWVRRLRENWTTGTAEGGREGLIRAWLRQGHHVRRRAVPRLAKSIALEPKGYLLVPAVVDETHVGIVFVARRAHNIA